MSISRFLALICALCTFTFLAEGQSGPPGGEVNDLLVVRTQPNVVFAATGGGVYRSTDAGRTWANRSAGLPAVEVNGIDGPSWRLYAGTTGQGVWRSVNGGVWTQTADVFAGATVLSVAVQPDDPLSVLACTPAGIYRSTDGGVSWSEPGGALPTDAVIDMAYSPFDPQLVLGVGPQRVFQSSNGGQSWTTTEVGTATLLRVVFDPGDANRVYFVTNFGIVYRNPSGGALSLVNGFGETSATAMAVDPASSDRLLAVSETLGILRSENRGVSWVSAAAGLPSGFTYALAAIPSEPGRFLAGFNGTGVFATEDQGTTWLLSSEGLTAANVRSLAVSPADSQTVWAALDSGGLFKSVDGGLTWSESRQGYAHFGELTLAVDPQNPSNLYAGSVDPRDSTLGRFSRSQDGGATWTLGALNRDVRAIAVDPADGQNILIGGSTGSFGLEYGNLRSENGGQSFFANPFDGLSSRNVFDLSYDRSDPSVAWAIGYLNGLWSLWLSTNGGLDFGFQPLFFHQSRMTLVEVDPTASDRIYLGTEGAGIQRSTPSQPAFSAANAGLPNNGAVTIASLAIAPDAPESLLVATEFGVYRSGDYGDTWEASTDGLPAQSVRQVVAADGVAYAATRGAGLYKSTNRGLTWRPSTRLALDPAAIVHGANFRGGGLAPGQITSVFGSAFSESVEAAQAIPLPLALAGVSVRVKDGAGVEREAELFFVSPGQINFEVPENSAPGAGTLTVHFSDGSEATVPVPIVAVNPGLFAAAGTGEGPAAAAAVRVAPNSTQTPVPVTAFSDGQHRTVPISAGGGQDPVILLLFGTGIRGASSIQAFIDGQPAPVTGYAAQAEFVGLDQVNVQIPDALEGAGVVEVYLVVDGLRTNPVTIEIE
jgi:uncharacterized protein (TIGR03437 family)